MLLSHLFHIIDSSFPTGGFAFSSGMEAMARLGFINDRKTFTEHLTTVLHQTYTCELPYILEAFEQHDSIEIIDTLSIEYNAITQVPAMHRGSVTAATGWVKAIQSVFNTQKLNTVLSALQQKSTLIHLPIALGITTAVLGLSKESLIELVRYITIRDQVSAAIRLGLLGPTDGARSIHRTLADTEHPTIPHYTQAYRLTPMLDLAQGAHHTLYSKLFQN